jgi:hypothetical protein
LSTMSCCRKIAFSAIRSARLRVISDRTPVTRVAVAGFVQCLRCCFTRVPRFFQELRVLPILR